MSIVAPRLISAGIDYVTCTARPDGNADALRALGTALVEREEDRRNKRQTWHAHGYAGWSSGSAAVGWRDDGVIVRASAAVAYEHGRALLELADHASRIDLQATAEVQPDSVRRRLLRHYREAAKARREGRKPNVTLIDQLPRGTTVTIGKRQSEQIGRIYDKFSESKGAYPPGSIRAECEFKGAWAEHWQDEIQRNGLAPARALLRIGGWFDTRGVRLGFSPDPEWQGSVPSSPESDYAKTLEWYRAAVAPGIKRWITPETRAEILSALGVE